jgi:fused signal recognition particle receptor
VLKKWFGKKDKDKPEEHPSAPSGGDSSAASPAPEAVATATASAAPTPPATSEAHDESVEPAKKSAWARLKEGLTRTRKGLANFFSLRRALDDGLIDELEAALYAADFGPGAVSLLIDGDNGIRRAWKRREIENVDQVQDYLKRLLRELLARRDARLAKADTKPTVILVAGVNGTGKTTSIAKLAHRLAKEGATVVLAAADTFRAAAVEQLTIWSQRIGVELVRGKQDADPASVAYQGVERALEIGADYLIVDTAGRLHTQRNLMRELEKIHAVLQKKVPGAPHESLLVLDATTGQNALQQAENFMAAARVTGIILTKLDGTAKGGIVVTINNRFEIPVKFVGVGESLDDLQDFDPDRFVDALLASEDRSH